MLQNLFKIVAFVILAGGGEVIFAQQNLVVNPSFEDTVSCPAGLNDLPSVTFWTAPTLGSPDYFNACNTGDVNVPNNIVGNQSALSGNAYVGITVYDIWNTWSYREYIQTQLQQVLVTGQQYWLNFYVSLADSSIYAIQEIGAYFSSNQINNNSMDTTLALIPQVEFTDSVITNKNGWTKISGSFTANGDENHLIIGNFNRSQNTTAILTASGNQNFSYYYIDNICVSTDSSYCANYVYTGIEEPLKDNFNIYPNPVMDYFVINTPLNQSYDLIIYNSIGQELYNEKNINNNNKKININNFNSNLLFVTIITQNKSFTYKLINL